jgi:hypothetical protein
VVNYLHGMALAEYSERGNWQMGDKSPKNNDKKRKQQTQQASKENKAAKKQAGS